MQTQSDARRTTSGPQRGSERRGEVLAPMRSVRGFEAHAARVSSLRLRQRVGQLRRHTEKRKAVELSGAERSGCNAMAQLFAWPHSSHSIALEQPTPLSMQVATDASELHRSHVRVAIEPTGKARTSGSGREYIGLRMGSHLFSLWLKWLRCEWSSAQTRRSAHWNHSEVLSSNQEQNIVSMSRG